MENSRQYDNDKRTLDLRKGWKQINQKDVEHIMNKKDEGNYWWFSEDKKRITTLRGGKIDNYKANETEVLFVEKAEKINNIDQETKSEILMDLLLSPDSQVKCTADAYEKARFSNKTTFRFITKGQKAVVVMDFSKGKKPKITSYPLDKYRLKMKPVKV